MRRIGRVLGHIVWWCSWPLMWPVLRNSERTRLALTNEHGEVLLVRGWISPNGRWSLPGGGLRKGEDPVMGLLREMQEEVGLTLQAADVSLIEVRRGKSKGFKCTLHFYAATVRGLDDIWLRWYEVADFMWMHPADLTTLNAEPDIISVVATLAG